MVGTVEWFCTDNTGKKPFNHSKHSKHSAMKNRQLLILLITVCNAGLVFGQLTAGALKAAVQQSQCEKIALELEQAPLLSEAMKYDGAICFYKNGDVERAMVLFQEVRQLEAAKQVLATYWEAKCHAALQQDSMALACLQSIPKGRLNFKMLAAEEFGSLAKNNETFTRLKQSVSPGFNIWTGLLAVIAVLGLLIGSAVFFGKSRFTEGEKWLAVVVFSFAVILIAYIFIWTGYVSSFPYLSNVWQFLTLLIGPSLYFYLKDIFKENYTSKEVGLHYLLPVASGLFSLPAILSAFGLHVGIPSDFFTIVTSPVLLTGQLLFYAVLIYSTTKNEWQVDSNIKVWTKVVAWGMIAYAGAFLSYFVLVRCSFFKPEWDYAISLVMSLGILAVAYMGLVQKRVFSSEPIGHFLPVKKYQTSSLTDSASESIKRGMKRLLVEEQVFKENELRLADLAAYLNISRHQLSQVINEQYGVNFFELINRYRVEYVKRMLADPSNSNLTIIQIAYEAGFNNKASFNRYFKKEIGMTPSAFRIREKGERV
ncbi:MAG TPA: AraC family transcriptional regulator [Bacteroidetes bacterium]|nr:AraC family transcriptional regulator [Bacteroidota bacterium]